jgi:hypothetical protein
MKTKYFFMSLAGMLLILIIPNLNAQSKNNVEPNKKYNVHRQYDENGNLIGYDSTAIVTWGKNTHSANDSVRSEYHFSTRESYDNPDSLFGFDNMGNPSMPDNKWIQDMMKHFGNNFPMNPSDSTMMGQFPGIEDQFDFSAINEHFAKQIQEMEKYMRAMMQQHMDSTSGNGMPKVIQPPKQAPVPQQNKVQPRNNPAQIPANKKSPLVI